MRDYFHDRPPTGVVVGYDGSRNAALAVEFALEEGKRRGVPVHLVHAFQLTTASRPPGTPMGYVPSVDEYAAEAERRIRDRWGDGMEVHACYGRPTRVLLAAAETADVLVVGARGKGGIDGLLLGSVSDQVLRHAPCPVVRVATSTGKAEDPEAVKG